MTWVAVGVAGAGLLMQYTGQRAAGKAAAEQGRHLMQLGEYEAAQLEQNALTEIAVSQRAASEERRRGDLAESRALALAAASGGGASDPTVVKLIAELAGEGSYRAGIALYEGEERARQMRMGAGARRLEGAAGLQGGASAQKAYNTTAAGGLLTGGGRIGATLYSKYGGTGPGSMTTNSPDNVSTPNVTMGDWFSN